MEDNETYIFEIRNYRGLFLILALAFLYCWIKFYAFYQGVAQGPFGSSVKGDFLFYVELLVCFFPIALFVTTIFLLKRVSKNDRQRNKTRLVVALILFSVAASAGVFSNEHFAEANSFEYLKNNYDDWHFFSDNLIMENLVLFFAAAILFIYKLILQSYRKNNRIDSV